MIDELDKNKLRVFQVILIFTSVFGILFAVINQIRGQALLASIEFIVALISFWLLIKVINNQTQRNFKRLTLIYVIVFFSIMMLAFSTKGVSITIFSWSLVIPLASYLLLGVKLGFVVTAIYYVMTSWLFFSDFSGHEVMQEKVAYANFIICALLFWGISHSYERANRNAKRKLRKLAIYDHLTGLYNRSMMYEYFDQIIEESRFNEQNHLAVMLFDLDKFKSINDMYGHAAGDEVLVQFAQIIKQHTTKQVMSFRLGGEEFAVFAVVKEESEVIQLAEKIRAATENITVKGAFDAGTISVSAGIDVTSPNHADLSMMLQHADKSLYGAKAEGRNKVVRQYLRSVDS